MHHGFNQPSEVPYEIRRNSAMRFDNPRILIADACSANTEWLRTFMAAAGCRPYLATDANSFRTSSLSAAKEGDPFQLALVDINLIDMELGEFRQWIEEHPGLSEMSLVLMAPFYQGRAGDEGHLTTLSKPVTESSLRKCLAFHLQGKRDNAKLPPQTGRRRRAEGEQTDQIRILVAEDNVPNQLVTCAILEQAGLTFEVVPDGRAAIKALESSPFDLVLMDCSMPVMDGFSATRSIRARESRVIDRNVPIIALTALAMKDDKQRCLQAGMDDYLSKPVHPPKLIAMIERHLEIDIQRESVVADHDLSGEARRTGLGLDPELLEPVIEAFFEDIPKQISDLEAAIESRDCKKLGAISHKLRGSSEILGTTSISSLAFTVEQASQRGDVERATVLAPKLLAEMQRLLTELT
jgi:two-component system sensor histidine kinase/response regulator